MRGLLAVCLILAVFSVVSAGCVAPPAVENGTVDDEGTILFGDAENGHMVYTDGTIDTWTTDASGNTNHTIVEKDGTTYGYMMTPDGTITIF